MVNVSVVYGDLSGWGLYGFDGRKLLELDVVDVC